MTTFERARTIVAAVVALIMCPILLYVGFQANGIPPLQALQTAHGFVEWTSSTRHAVRFAIEGNDESFVYLSKGGKLGVVEAALSQGMQSEIDIAYDPADPTGALWEEEKPLPVYQLSFGNHAVRPHAEVDAAWRADNRFGGWMGAVLGVIGVALAIRASRK